MRNHATLVFLFIGLVGFALVYWLWPQNDKLPILDEVNSFQLENVHGKYYHSNNKKVKLVTFFYTHCPDICPMTMKDLQSLQSMLKKESLFGEKVELVAISLDPKNDTRQAMQKYASSFGADPSGWKWLRGSPEKTKQIAKELQMQYRKLDGDFFSHSTTMYLIDEKNNIRALYDMANSKKPVDKDKILEDIRFLAE